MGMSDTQLQNLRRIASAALEAKEAVAKLADPMQATLAQTTHILEFIAFASPLSVLAMLDEIRALKGRIVEMEANARDLAFERSER